MLNISPGGSLNNFWPHKSSKASVVLWGFSRRIKNTNNNPFPLRARECGDPSSVYPAFPRSKLTSDRP